MVKLRVIYEILAERAINTEQPRIEVIQKPAENDFLELFAIETKGKDYRISKTIEIKKDIVFPVGNYHILQDCGIIAKDCKIVIQPGTNFYFDDCSFFHQSKGTFDAVGNESNKVQFLTEENSTNGHIILISLEARLEHFKMSGFKGSTAEGNYLTSPLDLQKIKAHFKNCELSDNCACMFGGAAHILNSSVTFEDTWIIKNIAEHQGGGLCINNSTVHFNKTRIKNCAANMGSAISGWENCNLMFDDCEIIGNTALKPSSTDQAPGIWITKNGKAKFKKTTIRNNLYGAITIIDEDCLVELSDDCIVEGNGESPFSEGMHGGKIRHNPLIIRKSDVPGANNLPAVIDEIWKSYHNIKENDVPIILNKTQKKYSLGESEMLTLTYGVKNGLENQKILDEMLKDSKPSPYRSGRRLL